MLINEKINKVNIKNILMINILMNKYRKIKILKI